MPERRMTISEVKAFLRRYRDINTRIDIKRAEIDRLRSIAARTCPSQNIGGSNYAYDRVGSIAAKIADIDAEINGEIDELYRTRNEIEAAIAMLTDERQRTCLDLRYISGKRFTEIARQMNYSKRQVLRIHDNALIFLAKKLNMSPNVT